MATIWLLPLGFAAVGIVTAVVALRRIRAEAVPAVEALHRTRTRLSPAIGALRQELSHAAHRTSAHGDLTTRR